MAKLRTVVAVAGSDLTVHIKNDPVMQTAVSLLSRFTKGKRMTLHAKDTDIPNAVAVANILSDHVPDEIKILDIKLDSESVQGDLQMTSIIKITLARE